MTEEAWLKYIREDKQRTIEDTIISFVNFYRLVNREELKLAAKYHPKHVKSVVRSEHLDYYNVSEPLMAEALYKLNVGDCYVAALAIGEVLTWRGVLVDYCDNDEHGFLLVCATNNKYYDTLNPQGVSDPKLLLGMDGVSEHGRYTAHAFAEKHLPDDHYGKSIVETFVRMYNPKYTYPFKISDRENETYV